MSDDAEDVVGVLTEQIEQRFGMSIGELKTAVAAAPDANRQATDVVRWHGLLTESQTALERAEDDLLRALETQPSEVDDPTMDLAHRVNAAVTARDGRAMVVRWLLDPDAPGKRGPDADRLARLDRGRRQGPAVPTSAPARPATAPATGRGVLR
ncbi:hypothetical protein C1I97_35770 [Streptomyces sp. NTH33]|uniref:hypothetical protein n=1 Tax=Streptomyces sp. NTH33 TaxID=1735453 RepID=UPI000DA8EB1E|nr:hypothetical protein [Streptomyces sp. NTH33]PZG80529.1 hypothetical protein C1I97_35770 [Streptomyces sp. NTH33]